MSRSYSVFDRSGTGSRQEDASKQSSGSFQRFREKVKQSRRTDASIQALRALAEGLQQDVQQYLAARSAARSAGRLKGSGIRPKSRSIAAASIDMEHNMNDIFVHGLFND